MHLSHNHHRTSIGLVVIRAFVILCTLAVSLVAPFLRAQGASVPESTAPPIVFDPSVSDLAPEDLNRKASDLENHLTGFEYNNADYSKTIGDFVGGKVKQIRVVHIVRWQMGSPQTREEIRDILGKVWQRKFHGAHGIIIVADPIIWSVEAVIEFEDGRRSMLIADAFGGFVILQDHDGKTWFIV